MGSLSVPKFYVQFLAFPCCSKIVCSIFSLINGPVTLNIILNIYIGNLVTKKKYIFLQNLYYFNENSFRYTIWIFKLHLKEHARSSSIYLHWFGHHGILLPLHYQPLCRENIYVLIVQ